ncbi:MAG: branched-chain amino acid ABC transporter permease [Desulfobacterales bacterium]|nr:branched-chain amino acid ABC transporter permease [Desulfobacterales bacterium]
MAMTSSQGLIKIVTRKLKSPPVITITLSIIAAVLASIDSGFYVIVNTIVTGGMWALVAMGLALVFGVMNITSFVHGEFFMIGGLTAYFVFTPFSDYLMDSPNPVVAFFIPILVMLIAAVAGVVVGILSELVIFRPLRKRTSDQWVMNSFVITLGLSVLIVNGTQFIFGTDFRGIVGYWPYPTLSFFNVNISFDRVMVFILAMLILGVFWWFMSASKLGRAIRAVSQDETGARMVGININGIQTLTMALSAALAALAGACLLFMYPAYPTVGMGPLFNSWFIVILAGMGNVGGAAICAFIVALLQVLTTVYFGEGWEFTIPAAVIILVLIIKPSGIFGSSVRGILDQ